MKLNIGIVIVNWNNKNVIWECLESIRKAGYLPRIVIVDNGSTDDSVEMVKEKYRWVKLLETGGNLGFARGNNAARKVIKNDYILFLNSDFSRAILKSEFFVTLNELLTALSSFFKVSICLWVRPI